MLNKIKDIGEKASQLLLSFFHEDNLDISMKDDGSPVTKADIALNQYLSQKLKQIENIPVVSEETTEAPIDSYERFWLIDPLDGTKEFVSRLDDFAINIALIENGLPAVGCIIAPRYNEIYLAQRHNGAFLWKNNKMNRLDLSLQREWHAVTSRNHPNSLEELFFAQNKITQMSQVGASVKFCYLAKGLANLYIRLDRLSGWDIAAGHILIKEIGYQMIDLVTQQEPIYDAKISRINPFIAIPSYEEYKRLILP